MRSLYAVFILLSISVSGSLAATLAVDSSKTFPPIRLAAWKSDFNATPNDRLTDLPPVLTPMDNSPAADVPQNVPVEAIPTPTAVSSGLVVLGGLAGVRLLRRIRTA